MNQNWKETARELALHEMHQAAWREMETGVSQEKPKRDKRRQITAKSRPPAA